MEVLNMAKKNIYKKYNLAEAIRRATSKEVSLDLGADGPTLDITETSGNLDIKFETYQTHFENIYYYITIYDYNKKEETKAGYLYLKHNGGVIDADAIQVLYKAIQAANEITTDIFEKLY
jgi:hypothetical protein